jgi:hypothetical protein
MKEKALSTWTSTPDGHIISLPDPTQLIGMPCRWENVREKDCMLIVKLIWHFQAIHIRCKIEAKSNGHNM